MQVKELIEKLLCYEPTDPVVLSATDENGDEIDLFDFYIDEIPNCEDINGKPFTEVRIVQIPNTYIGSKTK
jgi:hypothetical protein